MRQTRRSYYRTSIIVLGLLILALNAFSVSITSGIVWGMLGAAVCAALLLNFPIRVFPARLTLLSVVTLGSGIIFGGANAVWLIFVGGLLGFGIYICIATFHHDTKPARLERWPDFAFEVGANILALHIAVAIFEVPAIFLESAPQPGWLLVLKPALAFATFHVLLFLGDHVIKKENRLSGVELLLLIGVDLLPLPLMIPAVDAYPFLQGKILLGIGWAIILIAALLFSISRSQVILQKRVRELSTLSRVSEILRSSLELSELLPVIQEQVREILRVDFFYVALYDAKTDEIWYPLAVKAGERQSWPRRRGMADRLTDRVIREGRTLMLTPQTQRGADAVGFPPSEEMPQSWLGVPLITSEKSIGCLAVFDIRGGIEFSHFDIDLLTTISGQVGIAIENALLYEQLQSRAAQLETLNVLTGEITASLDLQEVLMQVCRAVALVGGSQRCAIYLQEPSMDIVHLAHSSGLSTTFIEQNHSFSIAGRSRSRCLRTGTHLLVTDLKETSLPVEIARALANENIRAYADFPLITPEGAIGFLSVFYAAPHDFLHAEVELLQTLAAQAALAVANARLHATTDQQLARRVQQLAILEAVGRELSAATLSERLFLLILDYAMEFTQTPWGMICIYDSRRSILDVKAQRGYPQFEWLSPEEGITGRAFRLRRVENIPDVTQDADYLNIKGAVVQSQLSVPLSYEGQSLGVITLESDKKAAFTAGDQSLLEQLAHQAAVALVNAQMHHETRRHREQLSAVINSVKEAILMFNHQGVITLANQSFSQLTSMAADTLMGMQLIDLSEEVLRRLGYDSGSVEQLLIDLAGETAAEAAKETYHIPDMALGNVYERRLSPANLLDEAALGWMFVWRDVSDEYRANQEREVIADALIHDLRSPISAVLGSLDLIDDVIPAGEHRQIVDHSLGIARRGAKRVLRLVESLMDVARMQSGNTSLHKTPLNLYKLVQLRIEDAAMMADEYGITLINEIPADFPVILADEEKIARVLQNLIDNAVKFSPEKSVVRVIAFSGGENITVQIIDQGPGIAEEYRAVIFERFAQITGQLGHWRGAGLGLAFCKLAVEAHGGKIGFEEPAEDQAGSIFAFTLPISAAEESV